MSAEFQTTGPNTATSRLGFTVEVKFAGGVRYCDTLGELYIQAERLAKPPGTLLYKKGFDNVERARVETIFSNVTRALEYLGHRVQIWS